MTVFSAEWFAYHQRILLWLLNAPIIGWWFRWVLCIRACDIGYRREIVEILPHAYTVANDDGTLTTDFRTHHKYGKRLYYAFRPLWLALHAWDMVVANRWAPALNAGFDTLTTYPSPSGSPVDGTVFRGRIDQLAQGTAVDETFTAITSGAGEGVNYTQGMEVNLYSSATTNQFRGLSRVIVMFDTSSIGQSFVTAVTMSAWGSENEPFSNGLGSTDLHAVGCNPTLSDVTLDASDYSDLLTTSFASLSTTAWTPSAFSIPGGYNDFSFNANGIAAINKTGITRLGWRLGWDINGSYTGTWATSTARTGGQIASSEFSGTSNDPKLVVTYERESLPANRNRLRPRIFAPGRAR